MNFRALEKKVLEWSDEKGILANATPRDQLLKTMEELGELAGAIAKDNRNGVIDGFGDVLVTLIIGAELQGLNMEDCLEYAYNEIKNRTGTIQDGIFVKDSE